MSHLSAYLLSVTAAAVFAAVVKSLLEPKTASGAMIHLLAGLLVVTTLIRPVLELRTAELPELSWNVWNQAEAQVQQGKEDAEKQMKQVISQELSSYVQSEARRLGAEVTVGFSDWEDVRPRQVTVCGRVSPSIRARIQDFITAQLGIEKEKQEWIRGS